MHGGKVTYLRSHEEERIVSLGALQLAGLVVGNSLHALLQRQNVSHDLFDAQLGRHPKMSSTRNQDVFHDVPETDEDKATTTVRKGRPTVEASSVLTFWHAMVNCRLRRHHIQPALR